MTVTQLDITQLAIDLNQAGEMAGRSLDDVMLFVANSMVQDMQAIVPVDTGNLKSAIKVTKEGEGRYRVGPDLTQAPYAWYVEFGTKPHIIKAKPGKSLKFQKDGKTIYAKQVRHPGTKAQPYVRPVIENWVSRLSDDAVRVGVQEVVNPS